jgi:hypothetical protein
VEGAPFGFAGVSFGVDDVAATKTALAAADIAIDAAAATFEGDGAGAVTVRDPDGYPVTFVQKLS